MGSQSRRIPQPRSRAGRVSLASLPHELRAPLSALRWVEGLYAAVALVLAASLPPPDRGNVVAWVHWVGTGMLAAMLAWRFGRPNRASWYVAAILCGYVLFSALPSAARLGVMLRIVREATGPTPAIALALASLVLATQIAAAVLLFRARAMRDPTFGAADPVAPRHDLPPR